MYTIFSLSKNMLHGIHPCVQISAFPPLSPGFQPSVWNIYNSRVPQIKEDLLVSCQKSIKEKAPMRTVFLRNLSAFCIHQVIFFHCSYQFQPLIPDIGWRSGGIFLIPVIITWWKNNVWSACLLNFDTVYDWSHQECLDLTIVFKDMGIWTGRTAFQNNTGIAA